MRKLYLKQNGTGMKEKFTFYDDQQQEIYQGQQTSLSLPPRFGLVDVAKNEQVVTLTGTTFSMMPEFKLTDSKTNSEICKIKKKFTMGKGKVTIKTPKGEYLLDGDFIIRDFKIFDNEQREIVWIQSRVLSWGDVFEININSNLIEEHVAIGILVGIDCAYYSDNRY